MTPDGDRDLAQHWLRLWLVAWRHQAITWTNVDWSSVKSSDIHIRAISQEMPQPSDTKICLKITSLKFHSNFPGAKSTVLRIFSLKAGDLLWYLIETLVVIALWWMPSCLVHVVCREIFQAIEYYSALPIYRGRVYRGIGYIAVACWTPFFDPPISRILQTWHPRARYFSRNRGNSLHPIRGRQFFAKSTQAYLSMRAGTHAVRDGYPR